MNPEVEEQAAAFGKREKTTTKKQHIRQWRLKEQISESRMFKALDPQLQEDRPRELHRKLDSNQEEAEDELVCVSTMVPVEPSSVPAEYEQKVRVAFMYALFVQQHCYESSQLWIIHVSYQVCGILKTVRSMHRQRVSNEPQHDENQSDHSKSKSIATLGS